MIYRVTRRTTGSLQPSGTFWGRDVLYCGTSLEDARVEYLRALPGCAFCGYGNRATEVDIEEFESEPEEPDDTTAIDIGPSVGDDAA